ncbi:MAG: response regulator [Alphaproteobacteria bacterium]|nr:response regulator [Alphaproteobacteria bacterium]
MPYNFREITVLVVEDSQPMLLLIDSLLQAFGIRHILKSENGDDGFKLLCEHNPDIVIADWMMRPTDGISLTRRIRNDPASPNQFVPVILMTGFSEMRRVLQARDAGVTEFLVKPFSARDLYRRMVEIIERPRQYVRSDDFFGPDRRRRKVKDYDGPMRRETDIRPEDYVQNVLNKHIK